MTNIKFFVLALALMAGAWNVMAQSADEDAILKKKINDAVMQVYNKQLQAEPGDYATRFARAYQYFNNDGVDEALADINQAIKDCPEKEREVLYDAYLLRAKIYDQKGEYDLEYEDLKAAFQINSTNPNVVDMIAKLALKKGDYKTAETNFNAILRMSPQNYDALYGLARVAAKTNDYQKAQEYCDRAVKLFPTEPQVYINRAHVFMMLGQYKVAAQDLILAMSVGEDESKAVSAIINMSDEHYDDVMNALQNSIDNAPSVATFYYLRYSIAMRHLHYGQALRDIKKIISKNFYDDASIYQDAAKCQFEMGLFDMALANIDKALSKDASNIASLVLKARIVEHQGAGKNYDAALGVLTRASRISATDPSILLAKARIYLAQRKQPEALEALNTLLEAHPDNNEALLLRGWLYKYRMRNAESALADFGMMLKNGSDMASLKGFALHELGREDEARKWAQDNIMSNSLPGGEAYAVAAALLSDIGDNDQALKYLESALANGYGSLYEVTMSEEPYVNLKLVRRHPDFNITVERYTENFIEKE
ncbi:MAG: tetratricopeptide repeat protein [Sodaliphilus sp.]